MTGASSSASSPLFSAVPSVFALKYLDTTDGDLVNVANDDELTHARSLYANAPALPLYVFPDAAPIPPSAALVAACAVDTKSKPADATTPSPASASTSAPAPAPALAPASAAAPASTSDSATSAAPAPTKRWEDVTWYFVLALLSRVSLTNTVHVLFAGMKLTAISVVC